MGEIPVFKPIKTERGWMLKASSYSAVVDAEGFTVWFKSRAKAMAAELVWDAKDEWWTIRPETL